LNLIIPIKIFIQQISSWQSHRWEWNFAY